MTNRDRVCIEKMLRETNLIISNSKGMDREGFLSDPFMQHGFVMALIIIGELSRNTTDDFRRLNPQIPWIKIRGLRNAAAHGYGELRMEDIWQTITISIPELHDQLLGLKSPGSEEPNSIC